MRRQSYEVTPTASNMSRFVEPESFEAAVEYRQRLQKEVEDFQVQLSERNRIDPCTRLRLSDEAYSKWRLPVVATLHARQQELRELKAWMARQHNGKRASEWTLLARAYHLIEEYNIEGAEADALLDAIEYVVPKAFLEANGTEPLAQAG